MLEDDDAAALRTPATVEADSGRPPPQKWTEERIRKVIKAKFNVRPCYLQIQIALSLYNGHDVVGVAATGSGKTLSFWIALVMLMEDGDNEAMVLVITPLNLLGNQNKDILTNAGIPAITVDSDSLKANRGLYKRIEKGEFRVVVLSPEVATDIPMHDTLTKKHVKARVRYSVVDEAHCVKQWETFRGQYIYIGLLRGIIPSMAVYIASATLPKSLLEEVKEIVRLRPQDTKEFIRSNDRPTIYLQVRGMEYAKSSYKDLAFLIPERIKPEFKIKGRDVDPPPKFLVFFDNKKEAEAATRYLWRRIPSELYRKVKWLHSTMSQKYRVREADRLKTGETWGLMVTDAFGMGMDLPDVKIIVQWGAPDNFDTFWQRVGRAARGKDTEAIALLLTEKANLDSEREKKEAKAAEKAARAAAAKLNPSKKVLGKRKAVDGPGEGEAIEGSTQAVTSETSTSTLGKRKVGNDNVGDGPAGKRQARGSTTNTPPIIEARDSGIGSAGNAAASIMMDSQPAASQPPKHATPAASHTPIPLDLTSRYHVPKARTTYTRRPALSSRKKRKEMHLPVDDFINCKSRNISCRRDVPTAFYENDSTLIVEDAKKCADENDPTAPCMRCGLQKGGDCCDCCNPTASITELTTPVVFPDVKRAPPRSSVDPYPPTELNQKLFATLLSWRLSRGEEMFGVNIVRQHGLDIFMPIDFVARIVDCHHAKKISSVEDLDTETEWSRAFDYGDEILAMLQEFSPLKPTSLKVTNASKQRKIIHCSSCGEEGHNKRTCPSKYKSTPLTENIRPPTPTHIPTIQNPPLSPTRGHRFQINPAVLSASLATPEHRRIFPKYLP